MEDIFEQGPELDRLERIRRIAERRNARRSHPLLSPRRDDAEEGARFSPLEEDERLLSGGWHRLTRHQPEE